jgi:hypothetical protein
LFSEWEDQEMANGEKVEGLNVERPIGPRLVVKSAVRMVPLDKLQVDRSYQREEQRRQVTKVLKDFSADAFGIPLVAQREDHSLWIVDGQQRVAALRKLGKTVVRVEVFSSEGPEYEAKVFRMVNANRQKLSNQQLFRAALTEGDKLAWAIKECVESCGFVLRLGMTGVSGKQSARELVCVSALSALAKRHGTDPIRFALSVIGRAWQDDKMATSYQIVHGLGEFYAAHEGGVDVDRMAERLNKTTPAKLIYAAGLGNWDRSHNMVEVLGRMYKKRLPKVK